MGAEVSKSVSPPTWKERLRACFSVDHRLLHVFGVPSILGLIAASLDLGGAEATLGMLVGGALSAAGVYLVTVGADRRLNQRLYEEKLERAQDETEARYHSLRGRASEATRKTLERIEVLYREIRAVFDREGRDEVTQVLATALDDVLAVRAKAYGLAGLDVRLGELLETFDQDRLFDEVSRHQRTIKNARNEAEEKAARSALKAAERHKEQIEGARARLSQLRSALSTIESNLSEFKVEIELRKADALIREGDLASLDDLGDRLKATGAACDEILGGSPAAREEEEAALRRVRKAQAEGRGR